MALLRVVEGPEEGREFRLPAYPVVVGRAGDSDLVLDDPRASRSHACIEIHKGRWTVRDLETHNGTFVDGMRIAGRASLHTGSRVRVGRHVLLFDEETRSEQDDAGLVLPGYEILEEAGRGTYGIVYRARQLSLDRIVALKVLFPRLSARPGFVERFVREARAAAHLHHPHVVQVFDVGQHDGTHYFTMEFMNGGTVHQLLERSPGSRLIWRDAVQLVADAARGLAFAEERGIVHRDVKPANLLLDERGTVKLGDLGTAVREDEAEGQRIGTPHFMSPEQARREPVTHASDVYGLGATLYRMLAGRTPFDAEPDVRKLVRRVADEEPSPVTRFAPGLPPPVALFVARMMSRDPAARPTAGECAERLARIARGVTADRTAGRRARAAGGDRALVRTHRVPARRRRSPVCPPRSDPGLARRLPRPQPGDAHVAPGLAGRSALTDALDPYVLPYALFAGAPLLGDMLAPSAAPWLDPGRAVVAAALLLVFAARGAYPDLARRRPRAGVRPTFAVAGAVVAGAVCGLVWIPLAELVPMLGGRAGFDPDAPGFALRLVFRLAGALAVVPVAEELLVRSFVPRLVDASGGGPAWHERETGRFTVLSFSASVLFFVLTHPEWLAALVVGIVFTALLLWTRRLRDVVLAHAVANAMLAAWIVPSEAWQWW